MRGKSEIPAYCGRLLPVTYAQPRFGPIHSKTFLISQKRTTNPGSFYEDECFDVFKILFNQIKMKILGCEYCIKSEC